MPAEREVPWHEAYGAYEAQVQAAGKRLLAAGEASGLPRSADDRLISTIADAAVVVAYVLGHIEDQLERANDREALRDPD